MLLDWMVESLSGIEVCRRLRRSPNTAECADIIMLTARGERKTGARPRNRRGRLCHKPFRHASCGGAGRRGLRRVRPGLAGETLSFSDDQGHRRHKVRRAGQMVPLGRRNIG